MQGPQGNLQPVLSIPRTPGARVEPRGIPKTPERIMQTPGGIPHTPGDLRIALIENRLLAIHVWTRTEGLPVEPRSPKLKKSGHFFANPANFGKAQWLFCHGNENHQRMVTRVSGFVRFLSGFRKAIPKLKRHHTSRKGTGPEGR